MLIGCIELVLLNQQDIQNPITYLRCINTLPFTLITLIHMLKHG